MKHNSLLASETVSRDTQFNFSNIVNILPNPDTVLRRTGKTISAYRELKNDPHVWACIQSRKSGVASVDYAIYDNGAAPGVTREIEAILADLNIQQIERDILEAPLFGFQPLEIIWKTKGEKRKFIVPERVTAKPQEWFLFGCKGELRYKKAGAAQGIELPDYKFLCPQYEADYLNPYGQSLLSKCYWHVMFKKGGLRFWANFTERYGMPLLVGQYNRGASSDEAQKLAQELAGMTEDTVIVAPSDINIELKEASRTSSSALYADLIKYCNSEISKAVLSQTLTTEVEMGSYAAAMTHFKVRREVIVGDLRMIESEMNKLIRYVVELNFGNSPAPIFKSVLNDSDNQAMIERDLKIAASGGIKFTKEYWMNHYGFKPEEIETIK